MSDGGIIEYIKDDAELYKIFRIIAEIREKSTDDFNSKNKALETLKTIFFSNGMDWSRSDHRIRGASFKGLSLFGVEVSDREHIRKLSLITDFIREINRNIMDECGICVVSASFGWDSDSCIVFAVDYFNRGKEDKSMHEYELIDKVQEYLEGVTSEKIFTSY